MRLAAASPAETGLPALRDVTALLKPRITAMVLVTTAGGLWLAPGSVSWPRALLTLFTTALVVSSAAALNSLVERDSDARMHRTRERPVASGRMSPQQAVSIAAILAGFSLPTLLLYVGAMPALLAATALVSYVWIYTPLKRRSTDALLVGAVPGAIPPLIGWTAAGGTLDLRALSLFALLFVWQLPHFLAIALYLEDDYARGGLKVFPLVRGDEVTRRYIVLWAVLLLLVSLLFVPLHLAGIGYGVVALVSGAAYLAFALRGLFGGGGRRWARKLMLGSVLHLTVLFAAFLLDAS